MPYALCLDPSLMCSNQETREARLGRLAQRGCSTKLQMQMVQADPWIGEGRSVTSLAAFDGPGGTRQTEAEVCVHKLSQIAKGG